jgi:cytochrome c556
MNKRYFLSAVFAGVVLVLLQQALVRPAGSRATAQEKGPGIAEFMLVVHDGQGIIPQMRTVLNGAGPADEKAWKALSARAAIITSLTETILIPRVPGKGDKASWKAKVGEYHKAAVGLFKATSTKNLSASKAEFAKISKSCTACHKAHR